MKLIKEIHCISVSELSEGECAHLDVCCYVVEIAALDIPAFRDKHNSPKMLFGFGALDQMPHWVAVLQIKSSWCYTM